MPSGRSRVGAAELIKRRTQYRHALPTRSLRDHPPRDGEGEGFAQSAALPATSCASHSSILRAVYSGERVKRASTP